MWSISILFEIYRQLPPNDQLDLKALTLKRAALLTLILCQRTHSIFTLELRYIKNDKDTIHIAVPSVLKYSRSGRHLKSVILKRYIADTKICPVEVLQTYLKATKEIRKNETKLRISFLETTSYGNCKNNIEVNNFFLKEAGIGTDTF